MRNFIKGQAVLIHQYSDEPVRAYYHSISRKSGYVNVVSMHTGKFLTVNTNTVKQARGE